MAGQTDATATNDGAPARAAVPTDKLGWWAIGFAALGLVGMTVLPIVGGLVGDANPGLSAGAMVAALILLGVCALVNLAALTVFKQRSLLNIVAGVVVMLSALGQAGMLALGGFFSG